MTSGRPLAALAFISIVWGYTWILSKHALAYAGPFTFGAARTLIGAGCVLLVLRVSGRSLRPRRVPELVVLGAVQTGGFVGLMMWALVEGAVGRTAFLVFTMPFWTLLLAWPLLGERIRGLQWPAVLLAAAGLGLILEPWRVSGGIVSNLLAVGAGACWATSSILVKRLQRRAPMDLLLMTGWQMFFGALPLALAAQVAAEPPVLWSVHFLIILLVIGIVSTALCWWLWVYVLEHVSAGVAGMGTLAIPVVAIALAALELGERPTTGELTGMGLITFALLILSFWALRAQRAPGGGRAPAGVVRRRGR